MPLTRVLLIRFFLLSLKERRAELVRQNRALLAEQENNKSEDQKSALPVEKETSSSG